MLFAYKGLIVPDKLEKKQSLNSKIKENLNCLQLTTPNQSKKKISSSTIDKVIECKVADGDIKGAIRILTSDSSFVQPNKEMLNELIDKHPIPSRDMEFPSEPDDSLPILEVTNEMVKYGIKSFKNGSAAGIDGIFPQVIKDLTSISAGDAGLRLLIAITALCNFISQGKICKSICPYLYGALLISLTKKDGGVRPIAIGNTFRRLSFKIACKIIRSRTSTYFFPKQLGFGIEKGCESIIHAIRTFIRLNKGMKKIILKIDMKNAFNCVERDIMLSAVKEQIPELFAMFWQAYRNPSKLFYGTDTILSQRGAQQGDPGGPLLFSLAIHQFVKFLSSSFNCFYLDDGTLADDPTTVLSDFKDIIEKSKRIGLEINPDKCELYFIDELDQKVLDAFNVIAPGIKVITNENFNLLGSPITIESVRSAALKKSELMKKVFSKLSTLNVHVAYFLLKNCLSMPKLTYFLRTSPLWFFQDIITQMDDNLKTCIESILNFQLDNTQWTQSSLPISKGGLGLRRIKDLCLPAFLASTYGVSNIVKSIISNSDDLEITFVKDAIIAWSQLMDTVPEKQHLEIQKKWDELFINKTCEGFLNDFQNENKSRFLALQENESNQWLKAYPSPNLGTFMDNSTFKISTALRLGIKICQTHTCKCGKIADSYGYHALRCAQSTGRLPKHREMNNIIYRTLTSLNVPAILEPQGVSRLDGKRADGMTIMPWIKGKSLLWDATCTDTFCPSNIKLTSRKAGSAAEKAVVKKKNLYKDMIQKNFHFVVFATETMGPWCNEGKDLIEKLGSMLNAMTGNTNSKKYLKERISIAIQRGNAMSILNTLPKTEGLDEVFFL